MQISDSRTLAASSPIQVTPSTNNISAGKVEITNVLDPVAARTAAPMRIDILENPANTFTYTYTNNAGVTSAPIAYTPPSQIINLPPTPATALFTIEISGRPSGTAPSAPEQFVIGDAFGVGNSTNITNLAKTQELSVINGGKQTFSESLATASATVGSSASAAKLTASTAEAIFTQAFNRNQSKSGVNIDEEAANLLKFQQAYQASSRIISVANTIFDTLLTATR